VAVHLFDGEHNQPSTFLQCFNRIAERPQHTVRQGDLIAAW
jgi:hypothetical protein